MLISVFSASILAIWEMHRSLAQRAKKEEQIKQH
jgi:hypothetical protein